MVIHGLGQCHIPSLKIHGQDIRFESVSGLGNIVVDGIFHIIQLVLRFHQLQPGSLQVGIFYKTIKNGHIDTQPYIGRGIPGSGLAEHIIGLAECIFLIGGIQAGRGQVAVFIALDIVLIQFFGEKEGLKIVAVFITMQGIIQYSIFDVLLRKIIR